MDKNIYLPLPSQEARKIYIEKKLQQFLPNIAESGIESLTLQTEDFSFRDMNKVIQLCFENAIMQAKKASHFVKIPGRILMRKYQPCFCEQENHGIKMSFSEKKNQIDLVLSFNKIQVIFDSFKKNPADKMVSDLEKYDLEHGIRLTEYEDLQIENLDNRTNFCYRLNPRKIILGLLIISMIALILWFYLS